ncbi:diadenylate cyclase [Mycoplasma leonicaptivi]|uniref:diadenylate cyclase n=1 Tax=Mycoplasma leonicaptivi TaxID=36742 RepID=UPI00048179BD|nr:DNA integrity scanning protein DisA nucleotide-binding domain protein [Mycoplasma leonicaptivi]
MNLLLILTLVFSSVTFILVLIVIFVLTKSHFVELWKKIFKRTHYEQLGISSQIRLINQLRETVEFLSEHRIGALITIENNDNLDTLRTDGIVLNANISSSLLISIFNKYSPLHDGAVIIRANKIYYASTFYKITRRSVSSEFGSRHRAALGISEQSDATTIVVSEENGNIRIFKNQFINVVKIEEFQEQLIKYLKG